MQLRQGEIQEGLAASNGIGETPGLCYQICVFLITGKGCLCNCLFSAETKKRTNASRAAALITPLGRGVRYCAQCGCNVLAKF